MTDAAGPPAAFGPTNRDLTRLLIAVDQSDSAPASMLVEAFAGMCQDTRAALARWNDLRTGELRQLNTLLAQQSLERIEEPKAPPESPECGR